MDISIKMAEQISKESRYPMIVIFGYDPESGKQHVTTFGKSKKQCLDAAKAGNQLKYHLGWPDDLCNTKPDLKNKAD